MKPERRTLQERVGIAMNASHLEHRSGREMAVDLIGGVGAAALHVQHGADRRREPVAMVLADPGHKPDPQDPLAAELGQLLRHIRDAGQLALIPQAVQTFALWLAHRDRFSRFPDAAVLLPKLAARALHELLSSRCARCGGTGLLEQTSAGNLVRGTGRMARNAIFRRCPVDTGCGGTGKPILSSTARRLALGLDAQRYDAERWDAHVKACVGWLTRTMGRSERALTVQLERCKKRV